MEIAVAVVLLAIAALIVVAVWTRRGIDRRTPARADSALHRRRAEAAAEVEERDVDDMLTAIEDYRRRRGGRDVGEELSDELMRGNWERNGGD